MQIPIKRFDKELPLPEYKTAGAAAMDCVARVDTEIPAKGIGYVPLNIAVKPPRGHFILLVARSSLHKRGLIFGNSVGIGDEDFSGNGDEYQAILYNFTDAPVQVLRGDRIVQLMVLPFHRVEWNEVDEMSDPTRGGIGSTGI
jgi:dUTP pyrophosphatase